LGILHGVQADILHLHHPNPLADISYLFSKPQGRLVITYHSDIINKQWASRLLAPLLFRVLDLADVIVATSPQYVDSSSILARYQSKIRIIPLGCEPFDYNRVRPGKIQTRAEPQYLFLGRLVPYKGLAVLLLALRQAPGRLWIAGTGPLKETLEKHIASESLNGRVELLGDISEDEKWQRLAACDALILPSITRAEAFGIVLLEAMAVGHPVVVSDLPTGVRMIVEDGVNGYRFPPGDAKALAAILHKLAADPASAKKMGESGRKILQERFTPDLMVDRYLRLYQDLCAT
jgi:rhamnosyl/mannosyltransferase